MASRLSDESLLANYDRGLGSFEWSATGLPSASEEERAARGLLDSLLASQNPGDAVQSIEPALIRHSLLAAGIEDYVEILPLLARDQVTHIMDFEAWHDSRLSLSGAMHWLQLHKQANPGELLRRFRDLEEEVQTGLLGPMVETYDLDAYEKMSDQEQDSLMRLPCGEVFYKIKSEDPDTRQFVEELVNAALAADIEYAYSLLAHSTYLPPNEQEATALRFRNARLEEEGFVSVEEAARLFIAGSGEQALKRWTGKTVDEVVDALVKPGNESIGQTAIAFSKASNGTLIDLALLHCDDPAVVATRLAHLANTVASASGVAADDRSGLKLVLAHTKGYCNLGLELLASDPKLAGKILSHEHPATIFKVAVAVFDAIRRRTVSAMTSSGLLPAELGNRVLQLQFTRKFGQVLLLLDREGLPVIGFEANEVLKAMFNRFPLCPAVDRKGEKMTFQPVHDLRGLMTLMDWANRLPQTSKTLH
ncbi:MAG: hypothetical protein RIQ81_356 [Pseudomonadota bacterium]|jgi:hypothetical protein